MLCWRRRRRRSEAKAMTRSRRTSLKRCFKQSKSQGDPSNVMLPKWRTRMATKTRYASVSGSLLPVY
jgi:hypothetical protein